MQTSPEPQLDLSDLLISLPMPEDGPTAARRTAQRRQRRRRVGMATAIAAVMTVAAVVAWPQEATRVRTGARVEPQGSRHTAPPGWKAVDYHGVRVYVPPTWAVHDLAHEPNRCLTYPGVYVGMETGSPSCPPTSVHAELDPRPGVRLLALAGTKIEALRDEAAALERQLNETAGKQDPSRAGLQARYELVLRTLNELQIATAKNGARRVVVGGHVGLRRVWRGTGSVDDGRGRREVVEQIETLLFPELAMIVELHGGADRHVTDRILLTLQRIPIRQPTPTSTTIGTLATPTVGGAFDAAPSPVLASSVNLLDCATVRRVAGTELFRLGTTPEGAGQPVCYVDDEYGRAGPPVIPSGRAFSVGAVYVPDGLAVGRASMESIVSGGGVVIELRIGEPGEFQYLTRQSDPDNPHGGYAFVDVRGHRGLVARIKPDRVSVFWQERDERGRFLQVQIFANASPDDLVSYARHTQRGTPR